jgi:hypothetical protein
MLTCGSLTSIYTKLRALGYPKDPIKRQRFFKLIQQRDEGRTGLEAGLGLLSEEVPNKTQKLLEPSDQPRSEVRIDSNHSSDDVACLIEYINPRSIKIAHLSESLQEQREIVDQANVPLTDSGYLSPPKFNNLTNVQSVFEESAYLRNIDFSLAADHGDDSDTKFLCSLETTVDPGHARNYVFELSKDIYSKLHKFVEAKNRSMLSAVLPELIKAFAIKIYHDTPNQENRNMMFFIYRRHQ